MKYSLDMYYQLKIIISQHISILNNLNIILYKSIM